MFFETEPLNCQLSSCKTHLFAELGAIRPFYWRLSESMNRRSSKPMIWGISPLSLNHINASPSLPIQCHGEYPRVRYWFSMSLFFLANFWLYTHDFPFSHSTPYHKGLPTSVQQSQFFCSQHDWSPKTYPAICKGWSFNHHFYPNKKLFPLPSLLEMVPERRVCIYILYTYIWMFIPWFAVTIFPHTWACLKFRRVPLLK